MAVTVLLSYTLESAVMAPSGAGVIALALTRGAGWLLKPRGHRRRPPYPSGSRWSLGWGAGMKRLPGLKSNDAQHFPSARPNDDSRIAGRAF
jgi:hypothetical protein